MKLFSLDKKIAVVTGGYGHIGLSLTNGLLKAGATVYIAARSEEKFEVASKKIKSNQLHFLQMDINSETSIKNAVKALKKNNQTISILVNNAISPVIRVENEKINWQNSYQGGMLSVAMVTDHFLPQLSQNKNSSVINISSMYGVVSPDFTIYKEPTCQKFKSQPYYGAVKAGVIQYTRYMAIAHAENGIRFNCISPGPFPSLEVQKDKTFIKNLKKKIPMNRIGSPEELEGACVFFASNASSFVTGQNLLVDGGWTSW